MSGMLASSAAQECWLSKTEGKFVDECIGKSTLSRNLRHQQFELGPSVPLEIKDLRVRRVLLDSCISSKLNEERHCGRIRFSRDVLLNASMETLGPSTPIA